MRLFVPAGQARARRFYAREGFVAVGKPFEFGLGLPVLEYQRSRAACLVVLFRDTLTLSVRLVLVRLAAAHSV
jgi:hypothetical protein